MVPVGMGDEDVGMSAAGAEPLFHQGIAHLLDPAASIHEPSSKLKT